MTRAEIRSNVVRALRRIAPEINSSAIETAANLRDDLDLDSMDFLNFVIALHDAFNMEIPEADYPHFYTLDRAVEYLESRLTVSPKTVGRAL